MNLKKHCKYLSYLCYATFLLAACQQTSKPKTVPTNQPNETEDSTLLNNDELIQLSELFVGDLDEILERDTLRAITTYSSTSYFLYRGQPMGYEYELTKRLADHLGVELKMIMAKDINDIFKMLVTGQGDLISYNLTVTNSRRQFMDFTLPLNFTHQVLVQRKPENWRQMKLHEIENEMIRNPIKLIGLPIHVRQNTSYTERLLNLQDELGGEIDIQFVDGSLSTDDVIKMVSRGEVPYTIADYNIAQINASYYQNLDIKTPVGVMQQLAWAVRKTSPKLKEAVDKWLTEQREETDFYVIYNKYFKNSRAFTTRVKSDLYSKEGNRISEYDEVIKSISGVLNWDWRLLASLIYQESGFDPEEESWVGATGLMQVMPEIAKSYGYTNIKDPEINLKAGVAHLAYLNEYWKPDILDSLERMKFIMASYNAGHNHVQDARRLAKKLGHNPDIWFDNVEKCMLLKSDEKYYNDSVVYYGYCRGEEPVNYVKDILDRFRYYVEFIQEDEKSINS